MKNPVQLQKGSNKHLSLKRKSSWQSVELVLPNDTTIAYLALNNTNFLQDLPVKESLEFNHKLYRDTGPWIFGCPRHNKKKIGTPVMISYFLHKQSLLTRGIEVHLIYTSTWWTICFNTVCSKANTTLRDLWLRSLMAHRKHCKQILSPGYNFKGLVTCWHVSMVNQKDRVVNQKDRVAFQLYGLCDVSHSVVLSHLSLWLKSSQCNF